METESQDIYQSLLDAGYSKEELEQQKKIKKDQYKGFMSDEAILFLIAKDYGLNFHSQLVDPNLYSLFEDEIDYDEFSIKLSEVTENMSNIVTLGRIGRIFPTNYFNRKDGSSGVVGSFILYDDSASLKVVLWDTHTEIMEKEYFQINGLVRMIGGYSKKGLKEYLEIHMGKKGKVIIAPDDINPKLIPKTRNITPLKQEQRKDLTIDNLYGADMRNSIIPKISGTVEKIEFMEKDKEDGEKSFLLKFILFDSSSSIEVILWDMTAIECLKLVSEGDAIELSNVIIKHNTFSEVNEIHYSKKSSLVVS
jgi:replication factor A1